MALRPTVSGSIASRLYPEPRGRAPSQPPAGARALPVPVVEELTRQLRALWSQFVVRTPSPPADPFPNPYEFEHLGLTWFWGNFRLTEHVGRRNQSGCR